MTWQRTCRHVFQIPRDELWDVVGDPRQWPRWSPAIHRVELDGPVAPGQTGHYAPGTRWARELHTRTAPPLQISSVEPGRRLVVVQPNPTGATRFTWTLEPAGPGTILEFQITLTGAMAPAIRRTVAAPLLRDWPQSCSRLHAILRPVPGEELLKVVIAGGSGTLGRAVAADLSTRGHEVVLLTRRIDEALPYHQIQWDGVHIGPWVTELADVPGRTAVVNLAGRLVDARPTPAIVADLRDSRVQATAALVEASQTLGTPLARWVQGSTTAIWSDAGQTPVTESSPLPEGAAALPQMTGVAEPWEAAAEGAAAEHRTVLRTSIVLQTGSPAFDRLTRLTRAGLGGRVGAGQQWFSWIHIDDWLTLVRAALGLEPGIELPEGVVVGAAPYPVRNAELMALLRHHLHRPPAPPTPAALVRLGSLALRTDPALGLTGRHATSEVLADLGFPFRHPLLDGALTDLTR